MIARLLPVLVVLSMLPAPSAAQSSPRNVERDGKTCLQYHDATGRLIERCPGEPRWVVSDPAELPLLEALPDAERIYGRAGSRQLALILDGTVLTSHYVFTSLTSMVGRAALSADWYFVDGLAVGVEAGGELTREAIFTNEYQKSRLWGALSGGAHVAWLPLGPHPMRKSASFREALRDATFSVVGRVRLLTGSDPDGALWGVDPGVGLNLLLPSMGPGLGMGLSYQITDFNVHRRDYRHLLLLTITVFAFTGGEVP